MDAAVPREGLRGRTVVVALDQGEAAAAVTRMAHELARSYGSVPCVIRAFDVGPAPHPGRLASMLAAADALMGDSLHEPQRRAVRSEVRQVLGEPVAWPVHLHPGRPADVIVHEAAEREAVLVVLGIRRHGMFDRVVRDETTLNVVRRADCTVLAVAPTLGGRPGSVVVGMDFTPASIAAARMAAMLLTENGTLMLVHVRTKEGDAAAGAGEPSRASVDAAFEAVVGDLAVPAGTVVVPLASTPEPRGGVATTLLSVASEHRAELIAVGSRRHNWLDRALEESVSTELVRDGRRSVLVVPPPPHRFAHEIPTSIPEAAMSTITKDQDRTTGAAPVPSPPRGPVMLATDGPPPSDAAIRTASRLAHRLGVALAPINVLHPMPALHPAEEINELAREQHVSLIVVDHGAHGILRRLADDEVSLQVVRGGRTPVYAVDAHEPATLRRIVVAVDFSAPSIRAAQLAAALIDVPAAGDDAVVSLLHVNPGFDGSAATYETWAADYEQRTARMFDALRAILRPQLPDGVLLETRVARGVVFDCIRDTAIELEADLVAVGTRSAGWLDRMLVGSVATEVLRHVRRSVLVVPPPPPAEGGQLERAVTGEAGRR